MINNNKRATKMINIIDEKKDNISELSNTRYDEGITTVSENSDVTGAIKELNDDTFLENFSNIDMKTRLLNIEISSVIAIDSLIALNFFPKELALIPRSKKRLAVSLNGKGREEIVSIANGMQEQKSGKSAFDRLSGMFGGLQ